MFSSASYGYLISSVFPDVESAVALSPIIMMPIILFGGMFTNLDSYHAWITWLQYLSPIRYGLEAIVRNEYEDADPTGEKTKNPIETLSFDIGFMKCLIILLVLTIALRIVSMLGLRLLVSKFQ